MFEGTDRFEVRGQLGKGGMGVVYRVWDREQQTEVALKRAAHPGQDGLYRLKREFRARAGLSHPNLIQLYELVAEDDSCFFTMELVEGLTFLQWIRAGRDDDEPSSDLDGATVAMAATATAAVEQPTIETSDLDSAPHELPTIRSGLDGAPGPGPVDELALRPTGDDARVWSGWSAAREARVRRATTGLLRGLATLHESGQMHRDIKSSNVMIEPSGRVVILDFGLMSSLAPYDAQSSSMEIAGTPSYMAPEHLRGEATQASDLYAVGILLYEALTSRPAYTGNMFEMLEAKDSGPPEDPRKLDPNLPDDLCDLAMSLVIPDAESRPSARAALALLDDREDSGEATALASFESPFVGRAAELARLRQELDELRQGWRARTVRVSGAPGAGKSRLVQSFLSGCAEDVLVLSSICTRAESVPFQAMDAAVDRLARHVRDLDPEERAQLTPRRAFALRRVFPSLRMVPEIALTRAPPQFDESQIEPADLRRMGFDAFRELLGRVAEQRTVVLWIDDLQWADLDSVNLLLELVSREDAPRVLTILTYRDVDRGTSHAIRMVERPGLGWSPVLELEPLGAESSLELMSRLAPSAEDEVLQRALERAEGNPFLAIEIARVLAVEGEAAELPDDLVDGLVSRRLEELDEAEVALVRTISVSTSPLPVSWAAQAAGIEAAVMPVVRRLCDQHILRETSADDLRFTTYHDLLRERVVAALPEDALRSTHRRLAQTLERQDDQPLEALFLHWSAAADADRAVPFGLRAAARAAETLAFESAASLYGQALDLLDDEQRTAALLERHADALANAGRGLEAAERYLEAAERGDDDLHRIRLRQQGAGHLIKAGYASRGWKVLRDVLRELGIPVPSSQIGCVASATWRRLRFLARKPARLRGVELEGADQETDPRSRLRSETLWVASTSLSMLNHTLSDCFRMRHMMNALRTGTDSDVCRVLAYEVAMESHLGGSFFRKHASRLLDQVETLCRRTGDPYDEAWRQLALVNYWFTDSNWFACAQAALLAEEIFAEECVGSGWERSTAKHFRYLAQSQLGELGALSRGLQDGLSRAEDNEDIYDALNHLAPEPMLAWIGRGRGPWAAERIARLTDRLETPGPSWPDNVFRAMEAHCTLANVLVDYSEGRCREGHARLVGIWGDLEKSLIVKLQHGRLCYPWFRALGALGAAVQSSGRRIDLGATTAEVDGICRAFAKDPRPLAEGYVNHLRGGLAVLAGNVDEAQRRFQDARTVFEEQHVQVVARACDFALEQLDGRESGREHSREHGRERQVHGGAGDWRDWAQEQSVTEPEKVFQVFVPFLNSTS